MIDDRCARGEGVIEPKNHYNTLFGVSGLKQILRETAALSAKDIIKKIMEELYNFAKDGDLKRHNGSYADDVSLLVIKKL